MLAEFGKFPFEHFAWGQTLLYYNRVNTTIKDHILGKAWEAQFIMLVAGKKCWARSVKKWLLKNQPEEVVGCLFPIQLSLEMAPPGFPHTMLNVKRVKHNMQLAFIEKLFTNREIGTGVQTRYLRFKGMSYESENYLCDISCVQLRKTLARFRCGNSQFKVVLSAWKGVPYAERLCRGCNLGRSKMKNTCSLFVQVHKKSGNAFVRPFPSLTLALLLSSCKLRTWSPWPSL